MMPDSQTDSMSKLTKQRWPGHRPLLIVLALAASVASMAGCDGPSFLHQADASQLQPPVHVDSLFPIDEEVRRFRATLDEQPGTLETGFPDRDSLVRHYVAALEAADTSALVALALSKAEFAYLYYPHTRYTEPPYELGPAVVWFQLENRSGRGLSRALQRYGGRTLDATGHRCDVAPTTEGPNRIWTGCVLERQGENGRPEDIASLGPIFERDGRFGFLSHANGL